MISAIRERLARGREEGGFTLIELMVVVLIIAILIAIAIPTFLGARTRAQNRAAQADLRSGLTAADVHFTDAETYAGFVVATADAIEPALTWSVAAPPSTQGTIFIRVNTATQIVLVTMSSSGNFYCLGKDTSATGGQVFGNQDATTYAGCSGGW